MRSGSRRGSSACRSTPTSTLIPSRASPRVWSLRPGPEASLPDEGTPALVAVVLPSFAGGGAERVALTLAGGLDRTRFQPHLVVFDAVGPLLPLAAGLDLPITALGRPRLSRAWPHLARTLRRLAPAVVYSTLGYVNLVLAALLPVLPGPCRLILREANLPSRSRGPGVKGWLQRAGARHCYPRAARILCPSAAIAADLHCDVGLPPERLVLLPNPVDAAGLRRAAAQPRRVPGPGPRFVAAGRLTRQKGFDRLLRWLGSAQADAHLTIFGDGSERAALVARAAPFGDRVRFAGHVTEPWADYAGADAFLMPSRWEGMPNAALEALAVGTPVIATAASGGLAELGAEIAAGGLTLAADGRAFARALAAVPARPPATLRPSLLPERFAPQHVIASFEAILAAALRHG
ncbi:MAG: glycosyltransferase [Alphaproteobacteria bacterium]|nr:glycosyltransferase [Alphaproteobacteria bacterium]